MQNEAKKERLLELLVDQAAFGLNTKELNELEALKREFPEFKDDNSFEFTASAIALSKIKPDESMPESLQTGILAQADVYFSEEEIEENSKEPENNNSGDVLHIPPQIDNRPNAVVQEPGFSLTQWLGWGVAALACIALIANIWVTRIQPTDKPVAENQPKEPTVTEQKQQLLASAKDLVKTNLSSPQEGKNLSGEIVWSNSEQKGFMTFRGLPANDPNRESYQLWIVDETQDEKTPINGGVFNVDKNGEVTIPIDPELEVKKPKQFAVTVEKPGGVVVSKQEKVVAVAKI